ncbi:alpha/beta hydrolase [Rhodococcus oryzae]|uniref:Alpha/beta hydrolase n=1 Tax=Rhodococcus oryzae TaxID=2571143 RepID=A0ABY2RT46_9NOCA|nr:alpha/beta fold hydrolase [Rhodococcus oryzae]TJZ81660.1 alpha/beta hydrolase [Rhodococcus oryzae]
MFGIPVPVPRDLPRAFENVCARLGSNGLADLRPTPSEVVDSTDERTIRRFRSADRAATGAPLLLVTPLAATSVAFDLRRGCSVVEYLMETGRDVYVVDYGPVNFQDRTRGFQHWVDDVIPDAVRVVSDDAGGALVHLAGWSLGGIFAVYAAAAHPELPLASLTPIASPFDLRQVPLFATLRPLDRLFGPYTVAPLYKALGNIPAPLTSLGFKAASADKYLTRPFTVLANLDDRDHLEQLEAVDRFMNSMYAYPGRTFGQLYHVVMRSNEFATGHMEIGGRRVSLSEIDVPTMVIAGAGDGLAPVKAVHHLTELLTGAPSVRFGAFPGGHLGVLTGRAARDTMWPALADFLARSEPDITAQ